MSNDTTNNINGILADLVFSSETGSHFSTALPYPQTSYELGTGDIRMPILGGTSTNLPERHKVK